MSSCILFRPASGWLVAALLTVSSPALAHGEDPFELWAAVPDSELSQMRGGLDLGFLVANFAIERAVRINGETVSLTRLVITDLPNLLRGGVPGVQLSGDLANLIQVGQGNARAEAINSATQAAVAETLAIAAPHAQATPAPVNPAAPGNSGVASSSNAANLQSQFGPGLAQAVALANGEGGVQRPAPIATPSAGTAAPSAPASPAQGIAPQPPNPPAASWQAATAQAASAAASGARSATEPLTTSISIPIGNTGQVINVTSIPNAAAFATSIQNSVQATRIDTETSISASLSSLAALRSSNFAAAMRQQAIDAVRR
jgi:hypothetical protein